MWIYIQLWRIYCEVTWRIWAIWEEEQQQRLHPLRSLVTLVYGNFGHFEGPQLLRTKLTKDRADSITSILRTDLYTKDRSGRLCSKTLLTLHNLIRLVRHEQQPHRPIFLPSKVFSRNRWGVKNQLQVHVGCRCKGNQTLWTQDSPDPKHFGTSMVGQNCQDISA